MAGRTPFDAVENTLLPLRDALSCVTQYRLIRRQRQPLDTDTVHSLAVHNLRPVPLRGQHDLLLTVGVDLRITRRENQWAAGSRYIVTFVAYFYQFVLENGQEVLAFHWTPESLDPNAILFPHAHIGPAITSGQTVLRPGDLHRAHIPTGMISLSAVIRLAIAEFGVFPLHEDWAARLDAAEAVLSGGGHA